MAFSKFTAGCALLASLSLVGLAGCSGSTASSDSSSSASSSVSASVASDASAGQTRTVTDIDGNEVEIPATVDRIGDLWHANNQIVLLLGGADKLVATTTSVSSLVWFNKVYPQIADVATPVQGTEVNMEELLATDPQVVLASNDAQIEAAESAGIPAVHVEFQDFEGLKKTVEITAEVIGTDEARQRAKEYNAYLDQNIELVTERLKDLSDDEKPSVLHIAGGDDLTKVDGSDSLIGQWMEVAGAKNSLDDVENLENVTLEQIVASNPDTIIVGGAKGSQGIESIKNDSAWADVTAVKKDSLIANPVGTFNWDRYSAEEALQVLWAAKTFHADKFQDIDLVSETQNFYKKWYSYDLSEEEANQILAGQAPSDS